jgi:23S rRNA (cytosine1962-C5)-methyltransferase
MAERRYNRKEVRPRSAPGAGMMGKKIAAPDEFPDREGAWAQIKYWSFAPAVFPNMISNVSAEAKPGGLIRVYDKEGGMFGHGLYNPKAKVPLRVIHHGTDAIDESFLDRAVDRAIELRRVMFDFDQHSEAYRVIHSDGDGLSGLIVDKYADALIVNIHSLGIFQRINRWLPALHAGCGTTREIIRVDPDIARMEGIDLRKIETKSLRPIRIREHGIRYEVDFDEGHKTAFSATSGTTGSGSQISPKERRLPMSVATPAASRSRPRSPARRPKSPRWTWMKRPLPRENETPT